MVTGTTYLRIAVRLLKTDIKLLHVFISLVSSASLLGENSSGLLRTLSLTETAHCHQYNNSPAYSSPLNQ